MSFLFKLPCSCVPSNATRNWPDTVLTPRYCSSDLWSGDVGASDATFGYNFRGFRIITATVTALIEKHGMGSAPGSRLLFGGCSAGAIGAMNALDEVAQMVPPGMRVQGLLDAAALVDINPDDNGYSWASQLQPLQTLVADVMGFVNPQLPQSCLDQFPGESWKCMWGSYRLPMLQTPYFANAPQFDSFGAQIRTIFAPRVTSSSSWRAREGEPHQLRVMLCVMNPHELAPGGIEKSLTTRFPIGSPAHAEIGYDTDNYVPSTPQQYAFVDSFQPAILNLINQMPAGTSVFSSTCFVHCLSEQTTFYDLTVNGITMQQAITEWFFGGQQVKVISGCQVRANLRCLPKFIATAADWEVCGTYY